MRERRGRRRREAHAQPCVLERLRCLLLEEEKELVVAVGLVVELDERGQSCFGVVWRLYSPQGAQSELDGDAHGRAGVHLHDSLNEEEEEEATGSAQEACSERICYPQSLAL